MKYRIIGTILVLIVLAVLYLALSGDGGTTPAPQKKSGTTFYTN